MLKDPMRFPLSERVLYRRAPLQEVVCQVRFPPILQIETKVPAEYQETLRDELPKYDRTVRQLLGASVVLGGGQPAVLNTPSQETRVEHAFLAEDGATKVTLGRDFVALSTRTYQRWEPFLGLMQRALDGLAKTYRPHHIDRVGLRYQNLIDRERIGLGEDTPWSELLRPSLLGLLADPELAPTRAAREEVLDLELPDGKLRVVHGLVQTGQSAPHYLIDADFFVVAASPLEGVGPQLNTLHADARSFFRMCLMPKLHEAMGPEVIHEQH